MKFREPVKTKTIIENGKPRTINQIKNRPHPEDYYTEEEKRELAGLATKVVKMNRKFANLEQRKQKVLKIRSKILKDMRRKSRPFEVFKVQLEDETIYQFQIIEKPGGLLTPKEYKRWGEGRRKDLDRRRKDLL